MNDYLNGNNNRLLMNYNKSLYNQNINANLQKNNLLLQQNPQFQNFQNSSIMKQMQRLQDIQNTKQIQIMNELDIDKERIKQSVIQPLNVSTDNTDVPDKWDNLETTYEPNKKKNKFLQQLWDTRTFTPYKNILKNFTEDDYKKIKKRKHLVVHKVTDADKYGVDEDYDKLIDNIEMHDDELKVIYSQSKKTEHKKTFEYNHKYKYRLKHNPASHDKMKTDNVSYYQKEQKKVEANNKKVDNMFEHMINTGIFNDDEIKSTSSSNNTCIVIENVNDYVTDISDYIPSKKETKEEAKDKLKEKYKSRQKKTNINV